MRTHIISSIALSKLALSKLAFLLLGALLPIAANAEVGPEEELIVIPIEGDEVSLVELDDEADDEAPSFFGHSADVSLKNFAWGIDLGTGVDMTANDMSYISIHGYLGYKNDWFRFLGLGVGMDLMVNNSSNIYPLYAMARTSFCPHPRIWFADVRVGISFNNINRLPMQTGFYLSPGIGLTLAKGKKFSSHLILGYTFVPLHNVWEHRMPGPDDTSGIIPDPVKHILSDLHYASIRIGCSF